MYWPHTWLEVFNVLLPILFVIPSLTISNHPVYLAKGGYDRVTATYLLLAIIIDSLPVPGVD